MRRGYAPVTTAVVAAVAAIVWWAPWSTTLVHPVIPARRAFGTGRVIHVVARTNVAALASGAPTLVGRQETEIWYDTARRKAHIVRRHGTRTERDTVAPLGALSPEPLRLFVLEYRRELNQRLLLATARGSVQGRPVIWLDSKDLAVAIDRVTYQPLWLSLDLGPNGVSPLIQLAVAETKPYDPADFLTAKQRKGRHL